MTIEQWLGADNQLGIDIWKKKYQRGNESFDEWVNRVSGGEPDITASCQQTIRGAALHRPMYWSCTMRKSGGITIGIGSSSCRWRFLRCWRGQYKNEGRQHMRKITVLDFANQIGVLSDEVPVVVKTDRKVIGRFRCLYEIPETAMPGVLEAKIDHVILRSDEITIQVKLKAVTT